MQSPDIFKDDEAYYADRSYLSNSSLKLLRESPTKFKLWSDGKWTYPSASHFDIGTALHALFLEGRDSTLEWSGVRRGKDYESFCQENNSKIILNSRDYDLVHSMNDKLNRVSEVNEIMTDHWFPELPAVMEYDGLKLKGKADAIVEHWDGRKYIVDLKTTMKSMEDFKKSARWMLYNQQAALYKSLFEADEFYFLVVQKEFPYEVGIFKASDQFLESGYNELHHSIAMYHHYFTNGNYKPFSAYVDEI